MHLEALSMNFNAVRGTAVSAFHQNSIVSAFGALDASSRYQRSQRSSSGSGYYGPR